METLKKGRTCKKRASVGRHTVGMVNVTDVLHQGTIDEIRVEFPRIELNTKLV